jgi:hypothetical protein
MGLDMYLTKKHNVQNWEHNKDKNFKVTVKLNGFEHPVINPKKVTYIEEEVIYWRKANAIHQWFVDNVQNGVDNCQKTYVEPIKLQKLLDTCIKVKEVSKLVNDVIEDSTVAEELLPTQPGFFFGGIEYDQYYLRDIEETIKVLKQELSVDHGTLTPEYYYRSSW